MITTVTTTTASTEATEPNNNNNNNNGGEGGGEGGEGNNNNNMNSRSLFGNSHWRPGISSPQQKRRSLFTQVGKAEGTRRWWS